MSCPRGRFDNTRRDRTRWMQLAYVGAAGVRASGRVCGRSGGAGRRRVLQLAGCSYSSDGAGGGDDGEKGRKAVETYV